MERTCGSFELNDGKINNLKVEPPFLGSIGRQGDAKAGAHLWVDQPGKADYDLDVTLAGVGTEIIKVRGGKIVLAPVSRFRYIMDGCRLVLEFERQANSSVQLVFTPCGINQTWFTPPARSPEAPK